MRHDERGNHLPEKGVIYPDASGSLHRTFATRRIGHHTTSAERDRTVGFRESLL